jgi:hypothetical protein
VTGSFVTISPEKKAALPINNCWKEEFRLIKLPLYCGSITLLIIACEETVLPLDTMNHAAVAIRTK